MHTLESRAFARVFTAVRVYSPAEDSCSFAYASLTFLPTVT